MSKCAKRKKQTSPHRDGRARAKGRLRAAENAYREAARLASAGEVTQARRFYERLKANTSDRRLRALVHNDLAVIAATEDDVDGAIKGLRMSLALDSDCEPARLNLAMVEADLILEHAASGVQSQTEKKQSTEVQPAVRPEASVFGTQSLPKCLVLFITYNRLDYTTLALEAVLQIDYPAVEIVVWDNASTDGTPEYLKNRLSGLRNVRLEFSSQNVGVVHPMNTVWFGKHDSEVLAKVDNDTLVPPELFRRLAECHVRTNHFGALSGFHFRKEGEAIADEGKVVTVDGVSVFRQRFVGGCAIMARRDVLERIGPIPSRRAGSNRPFMDGGWTWYQQRLDELGYINGYPWPFVHVDHMEDTRSPHCIRTEEHEQYKRSLRGMSLEEFTQELCVWKPH